MVNSQWLMANAEFASGIARDRFGSHLPILQTSGTRDAVGFLSIIARVSKRTTKAVPSDPAGESVPRAVASVAPEINPLLEPRSLPLAVLIRCPNEFASSIP